MKREVIHNIWYHLNCTLQTTSPTSCDVQQIQAFLLHSADYFHFHKISDENSPSNVLSRDQTQWQNLHLQCWLYEIDGAAGVGISIPEEKQPKPMAMAKGGGAVSACPCSSRFEPSCVANKFFWPLHCFSGLCSRPLKKTLINSIIRSSYVGQSNASVAEIFFSHIRRNHILLEKYAILTCRRHCLLVVWWYRIHSSLEVGTTKVPPLLDCAAN